MTSIKKYECPHCEQTSSRKWNLKVHIDRAHGTGKPYSSSGFPQANANSSGSIRGPRDANSPSSTFVATNKISEARRIWQGSAMIDQIYRLALEVEGNRIKFNKVREVFGGVPYPIIQQINAEPLNFSFGSSFEPPILPVGASFHKMYSISPPESHTVKNFDARGAMVCNKTTEKPEDLTFDHWRKIVPEVTSEQFVKIAPGTTFDQFRKIVPGLGFERYREIRQTSANDWKIAQNEKIWLKRNLFGELV
jgi:hypothetical protein